MDNLSAVQIATANRPLFMISFNSNSSLFRVSVNCVNTCYFFAICSFSPKKHNYKEKLRDGTNLSTMTEHPVPNAVTPRRFHSIYYYEQLLGTLGKYLLFIMYLTSTNQQRQGH